MSLIKVKMSSGGVRPSFVYRKSLGRYYMDILKQCIPGILLGVSIDKFLQPFQDEYGLKPAAMICIQVAVSILVLYLIETYISIRGATTWQNTTPGIFFVAVFFGTQFNFSKNVQLFFTA